MIIDFATMLRNISDSNVRLLKIIQQSGNIIDDKSDDTETISEVSQSEYGEETVPGTTGNSKQEQEQKTNQDPPPLFEDVAPLQYKKGEKEIILRDSTGNTIATMVRIDVKPKS
jgi:hypothetical protein